MGAKKKRITRNNYTVNCNVNIRPQGAQFTISQLSREEEWGWRGVSVAETKRSADKKRDSYRRVCLSLCLSVIFKRLCMLLQRGSPLQSILPVSRSTGVLCPLSGLLVIILLLIIPYPSAPFCIPPPSFLSLLSLFHTHTHARVRALALFHCEEGKQHQWLSHSNSPCNRVQTAPCPSPSPLPPSFSAFHPCRRKTTGKKPQRCSSAGEDPLSHFAGSRALTKEKVKEAEKKWQWIFVLHNQSNWAGRSTERNKSQKKLGNEDATCSTSVIT